MAYDYCTTSEVFAYGDSAGTQASPSSAVTVLASIITGVSRAIDARCNQAFSRETYSDQRLTGGIDRDGVFQVALPVPTLAAPTAASYRVGTSTTWLALALTDIDVVARPFGARVYFLDTALLAVRGQRVSVRLSYIGGYADREALPADLRLAAQAASWYEFTRRSAPQDQTALPELGMVITPGSWPRHVRDLLNPHTRQVPS